MNRSFLILFFFIASRLFAGDPVSGWKVITNKADNRPEVGFDVFNEKGEKVYSIKKTLPVDVPFPSASVFQAGELMVVSSFDGIIEFYNNKGELVNTIKPDHKSRPKDERTIKFETKNNESAILISEPEQYYSKLLIVTPDGEINTQKKVEGTNATGIAISKNGSLIAAGTYSWIDTVFLEQTTFFNNDGDEVGKVPLSFTGGRFNKDETEFLGFTNSNLFCVDIENENIIWSEELASDKVITDAVIKGDKVAFIQSELPILKDGKWFYSKLELEILDEDGDIIKSKKLPEGMFEEVSFAKDNNLFLLDLDGKTVAVE